MTTPPLPPTLTRNQSALLDALADRDRRYGSRLSAMFLGAIAVLGQGANPERMVHSAQSMRELLEKLPQSLDAPVEISGAKASDRLMKIVAAVEKAMEQSECYDRESDGWDGRIDAPLQRMLVRIVEVVIEHRGSPSKADRNRHFLREVGPLAEPLPRPIEEDRLRLWKDHDRYFQGVAHHNLYPTESEYAEHLQLCTTFLLDHIRPQSVDTLDALDRLIQEAE